MSSGPNAPAPAIPGVELLEVIGSGGSGVVYRGRQSAFDREVAVKVASTGTDAEDDAVARWEREVTAVGRLSNHPNIVPVFDAGITERGSPYLVMPFVPGGTLGDRLRHEGPMSPDEVVAIGTKLAGTLATVHAAGVLHRDVKPDNVLWSPHGEPQLSDFGIARLQDITTSVSGNMHATIAYAAPEVLAGESATEASDVYGLGATLYACLTGSAPHPSGTDEPVAALVARVVETDPTSLTSHGVPAGLAAVVERAIARRPADRYPGAVEFRDALAQAGLAPTAAPHTQVLPVTEPTATRVEPVVAASDMVATSTPATQPAAQQRVDPPGGRSGWTLWLAVLGVLVVAGGLLVLASMQDDDATDDTTAETTAPPADDATTQPTEAPTTEAPTTEPATTEPPAEEASASAEADDEGTAQEAADTAVDYIRTLDEGDFDDAWAMTTPRFQAQQDRDSWEAFWGGYDVEIVGDPRVDLGSGTVTVPLRFDDQREDYVLDVARQGGGWLIDGPVGD